MRKTQKLKKKKSHERKMKILWLVLCNVTPRFQSQIFSHVNFTVFTMGDYYII
jgi:hypothetical protein